MKSEATVFSTWVRDDELRHPDDSGNVFNQLVYFVRIGGIFCVSNGDLKRSNGCLLLGLPRLSTVSPLTVRYNDIP
jgi:hypothetical protein